MIIFLGNAKDRHQCGWDRKPFHSVRGSGAFNAKCGSGYVDNGLANMDEHNHLPTCAVPSSDWLTWPAASVQKEPAPSATVWLRESK